MFISDYLNGRMKPWRGMHVATIGNTRGFPQFP